MIVEFVVVLKPLPISKVFVAMWNRNISGSMRASYMIYLKNQTRLSVNVNDQENGKTAEHHAADADYGIENCSSYTLIDDNDVDEDFVEGL